MLRRKYGPTWTISCGAGKRQLKTLEVIRIGSCLPEEEILTVSWRRVVCDQPKIVRSLSVEACLERYCSSCLNVLLVGSTGFHKVT